MELDDRYRCEATGYLTPQEADWLDALPDASSYTRPGPVRCELREHAAGMHSASVQVQDSCQGDGQELIWWVSWSDAGRNVPAVHPGCPVTTVPTSMGPDVCTLVEGHPGRCVNEWPVEGSAEEAAARRQRQAEKRAAR